MIEKNPRGDGEYLNSLARGLAVLRAFGKEKPRLSLSELAEVTELNPAVVRRCLNTLMHLGYVAKVEKQFILRPEVFSLGTAYIESMNLEELVRPALQEIRDKTGFSTAMAILSGQDIMFLVYVSTRMLTRIAAGVGTRFPAYATAAGRVMLACQAPEKTEEYLRDVELESLTPNTIANKTALKKALAESRQQGYAVTAGELDYGITSVAVPIFTADKRVIASISSSTSMLRGSEQELINDMVPELRHAAGIIEMELKRSPNLIYSLTD